MNSYEKKLEFLDWEFGVFFHFGIRSFFPGHKDWDGKEIEAQLGKVPYFLSRQHSFSSTELKQRILSH